MNRAAAWAGRFDPAGLGAGLLLGAALGLGLVLLAAAGVVHLLLVLPVGVLVLGVAWRFFVSRVWLRNLFLLIIFVSPWIPPLATLGPVNLRAGQVILPFALVAFLVQRWGALRWPPGSGLALLLLGAFAFWTVVQPATRLTGLSQVLLLALNLLCYALTTWVIERDSATLDRTLHWLGWCLVLMTLWTLAVMIGGRLDLPYFSDLFFREGLLVWQDGQLVGQVVERFIYGVIVGGFFAAFSLVFLVLQLEPQLRQRWKLLLFAVAGLTGLALSFARGPILGFICGLVACGGFLLRRRLFANLRLVFTLLVLVGLVVAVLWRVPAGQEFVAVFWGRVLELTQPETFQRGNAAARAQQWALMLDEIAQNPLIGQGALSYRTRLLVWSPEEGGSPPASENVPLEIFHSAGLLGFAGYVGLHLVLAGRLFRLARSRAVSEHVRLRATALLGGLIVLVVTSLTNPFAWSQLYWAYLGLCAVASEAGAS
jgi:hypothetical protein